MRMIREKRARLLPMKRKKMTSSSLATATDALSKTDFERAFQALYNARIDTEAVLDGHCPEALIEGEDVIDFLIGQWEDAARQAEDMATGLRSFRP